MGVNGRMLKFIHNYLNERTIKVKIGNTSSRSHTTTAGVPQGGVLSATCFIVAINSILDSLPTGTKGSLYADDLVIYNTSSRLQSSARTLQNFIGKLESEAQSMGLRLSPPKSEVIHFYRNIKGGKTRDFPPIRLYGEEIPKKETTKFLGMILDRKLDWKAHITALKGEIRRALNVLRVISLINFGPDRKTLLRLYWALGKSKLDYGSQIYSSASVVVLETLNPVHSEAHESAPEPSDPPQYHLCKSRLETPL